MREFVLYADDDADDKAWVADACKALDTHFAISFVENGREALNYLQTLPEKELPSLIVLDLNMPVMDGRQTLQKLKAHPVYGQIPVAIVSTSSSNLDREICKRLGATKFLVKPASHHDWQNIIHELMPLT